MMSLPLIVVANASEKKRAKSIFKNYPIKVTGEGFYKVLTSMKTVNKKRPIINFGLVGSAGYKIGATLEVGFSKLLHPNYVVKDKTYKLSDSGVVCYTSIDFVIRNETKNKKCIFDMELYFLLALGYNVIKSVKIVGDNLNLKQYFSFEL